MGGLFSNSPLLEKKTPPLHHPDLLAFPLSSAMPSFSPGLPPVSRAVQWRRDVSTRAVDRFYVRLSGMAAHLPHAQPERHSVERVRGIPYTESGLAEHTLDVYRPVQRSGPLPIALYFHGGAFRSLSKETHWLMGLVFARRGYVVFNVDYRLAPQNRFPAAAEDACAAYAWVVREAARWGGDPQRIVVTGESAGANLAAALAIASCYRRPEPWAQAVWDTGLPPAAVVPACGVLQVSDPERFRRRKKLPFWLMDQIAMCSDSYLPGAAEHVPGEMDLADPLCMLERALPPDRPLPPFFSPVGTSDPLLDDTRRLDAALKRLGVLSEVRYYPGEMHAFHALLWRSAARDCWKEMFAFLAGRI